MRNDKVVGQGAKSAARPAGSHADLVFRRAPHMDALVFTSLDRALEIDRLHRAISQSATWGEFRKRIGREEYERLFEDQFEIPEPDTDPEDLDHYNLEPKDDGPFSSDAVPGFCDGDYPPWLAQEIDAHVPRDILERFAKRDSSVLNGSFYRIESKHQEAIIKALTDAGFLVEERKDLEFW